MGTNGVPGGAALSPYASGERTAQALGATAANTGPGAAPSRTAPYRVRHTGTANGKHSPQSGAENLAGPERTAGGWRPLRRARGRPPYAPHPRKATARAVRERTSQALGATFERPLMMRSIASPPVGSVRLASIFSVNFIRIGCVRPRSVAIFMIFGLPMSFTNARPSE